MRCPVIWQKGVPEVFMSRKRSSSAPVTRVMRSVDDDNDVVENMIRLAWADRVTFEEIEAQTGLNETAVIRFMRRHQTPETFRRWRKRVHSRATKRRARFESARRR